MNRRKKSLTYLLLLPLLLVVLLQGIVPFSILLASGTRETMERNTVDIGSYFKIDCPAGKFLS